ncbi:glycosyltransferase family 4 protein [Mariniflexile gromovii]|uniref:Glycosyltransferase family 4 protein n=1 Tax=Mariniflexile gromovii TaxID=362523 RepID=A0ABS4BQJ8_9FLAO|nr:glycosyltransferase family 4 protein [Mariniflexile gromovii]MBP0902856.1 glycosyltransferase family 4 protein [Mariniflexile gromovii]
MRIVHVITAFGIGGAEKLLVEVINRQIVNHEVYLVYLKKTDELISLLDKRVKIKNIPLSIFITKKIRNFYISINPDIIHTHLGHADFFGIWSARNVKAKIFCTMHNTYIQQNILDRVYFMVYRILFTRVVPKITIISISKSVEQHVLKTLCVSKDRSFVLFNAIPPNDYFQDHKKQKDLVNSKKTLNLLFVGRLVKQKAVHTLLQAIRILKNKGYRDVINVLIVGEGVLRVTLQNLSKDLQIDDIVKFEGEIMAVNEYYDNADVFILPSIWEGFGIVILEAFRAKLAVIATNIEGPSELITDNFNGLLFKPNDYEELAEKIILLIEDELLRINLANNGYKTFNDRFNINKYVESLNEYYEN